MSETLQESLYFVPPLEPLFGCRPWTRSSEVEPHEPCEVCHRAVKSNRLICAACMSVSPRNERRLRLQRDRQTAPKPDPKPSDKPKVILTRKEKRHAYRIGMKTVEGRKWLEEIGLTKDGIPTFPYKTNRAKPKRRGSDGSHN